ncbi:MAG: PEP-CTERM sorting domain-containing protein [Oculatellaceae cyanobacterium bins.114]|nr:PEP-CTERM sorting domain-containing protein [Oculatellaceae cyanobacterium bins.114]
MRAIQTSSATKVIALAIAPLTLIGWCAKPSFAEELEPVVPVVIESPTPVLEELPDPTPVITPTPTVPPAPQPVSLNILNPSFEEDIVGGDGAVDSITGWQILSSSPWSVGTYRPGSGSYAALVPDGVNVAYANSGSLFQRLTDSLTANTQYTLGFYVGSRPPYGFPGYQVDLLAGETVIATTNSPTPQFGQFISSDLLYTASDVDPLLGQPLAIRLSSSGIQINFDNIRLTSLLLTPPDKEPETVNNTGTDTTGDGEPVVDNPTPDVTVESAPVDENTPVDLAIAPEDSTPAEIVEESAPALTVEPELLESNWVFAARLLPATSEVRELAATEELVATEKIADDVKAVPEPTAMIGLLLSAASLTRLKRRTTQA